MSIIDGSLDTFSNRVRQATSRRGSTLVWVMVVVLVMIIALGIGLTAVSGQFNLSSVRHEEHQAYYTALSSTETIAAWITESTVPDKMATQDQISEADVIKQLLDRIAEAGEAGITIDEEGIPEEAGTCTVNLRWLDGWPEGVDGENHTQLKITSTATFAGVTETVSLTLTRDFSGISTYGNELEASDFSTDDYVERAGELDALASGGVVALYESGDSDNRYFNEGYTGVTGKSNKEVLKDYIPDKNSTLEARWTNVRLTNSSSAYDHDNNILGTQRHGGAATDWRRFMVPENGRITIDPLEEDDHGEGSINAGDSDNTRVVGLAIHDTAGKEVLFRLASGTAALGTSKNVFVVTTSSDSGTKIANDITTSATFQASRSTPRYASLITLDFTDNAENTENLEYYIDGNKKTYAWHPDNWKSMDLFVQSSGKLDTTNLVLGPFAHKYGTVFDYWSWGEFRDSYHGQAGDLQKEWPDYSSKTGLPVFSVDFGKNAGFWILDKSSSKYFRIMQGVNILDGTIYSTRKTIIGGALIRSSSAHTTDNLNRALDGWADFSADSHITYVGATTRFSQLIYNTDIILMAPSSGTATSEIRRAQSWRSRQDTDKVTKHDTKYEPTMTIKGGTIYVGERQHLTIQGTTMGYKDWDSYKAGVQSGSGWVALDRMWISPDKIVVAAGGALTIQTSVTTNIITDIYVEGGTLNINAGAKIKGNIYAYNGGTVNILGNFQLDAPDTLKPGQEPGGILIYGEDTKGTTFGDGEGAATITDTGKLNAPVAFTSITGNSGRIHLVGGDWGDLVTGGKTLSTANAILCDGYVQATGRCPHYNGIPSSSGGGGDGSGGGGDGGDGETTPTTPGTGIGSGVSSGGGWIVGTYDDS